MGYGQAWMDFAVDGGRFGIRQDVCPVRVVEITDSGYLFWRKVEQRVLRRYVVNFGLRKATTSVRRHKGKDRQRWRPLGIRHITRRSHSDFFEFSTLLFRYCV